MLAVTLDGDRSRRGFKAGSLLGLVNLVLAAAVDDEVG